MVMAMILTSSKASEGNEGLLIPSGNMVQGGKLSGLVPAVTPIRVPQRTLCLRDGANGGQKELTSRHAARLHPLPPFHLDVISAVISLAV